MMHYFETTNLVPLVTPDAPKANAAARLRPSAIPPAASTGMFNSCYDLFTRTLAPIPSGPGCPVTSKVAIVTMSAPISSIFRQCLTEAAL